MIKEIKYATTNNYVECPSCKDYLRGYGTLYRHIEKCHKDELDDFLQSNGQYKEVAIEAKS